MKDRPVPAPHAEVAGRFRYFLDATGLDRERFVEAVDGAIGARSLYSILSGARKPSGALAVLIEKLWGFRAEFLLDGKGEMWSEPLARVEPGPAGGVAATPLSGPEREVLAFMRRSVGNARMLARDLEAAQLWERLWERLQVFMSDLEEVARSEDPRERLTYPAAAQFVYEECRAVARYYRQWLELRYQHRVDHHTEQFFERFIGRAPAHLLDAGTRRELALILDPVERQRRERARALQESLERVRATLEAYCGLESPTAEISRQELERDRRRRAALDHLEPLATDPRSRAALEELRSALDAPAELRTRLLRLVRGLAAELEVELPVVSVRDPALNRATREVHLDADSD